MPPLQKTNRLLQIFLTAFLLIGLRVWHLAVIQREEKLQAAKCPQQRTIVSKANRGCIVDRFGIPLAQNRICYTVSVYYSQFSQIPSLGWKINEEGKRERTYPRKEHIHNLSLLLGQELSLDPIRIEDLIHSKACLFPHAPFAIKSKITEEQYYRLKARERQWAGLHVEIGTERFYPLGKTGCHVLGHLGAINQKEYLTIASELDLLEQMMLDGSEEPSMARRYRELKERAYTINDFLGKAGIEKQYEEQLRGFYGKTLFEVDQKGRFLRALPGSREPIAGKTIALTISAELQQFCESLLIQDEHTREGRSIGIDAQTKTRKTLKQPWIKGGAIVALNPTTGEILALASTPRFDPNDFSLSRHRDERIPTSIQWQESPDYIANIWNGTASLYREKGSKEETTLLSWDLFLRWILPLESPITTAVRRIDNLKTAIHLQEDFETLLYCSHQEQANLLIDLLFPNDTLALPKLSQEDKEKALIALASHSSDVAPCKRRLELALGAIPHNEDKLFALDLCRLAVYSPAFSDSLIEKTGSYNLSSYRSLNQTLRRIEASIYSRTRQTFYQTTFRLWREENQKTFLKERRQEEKEKKTYARPYLDYLDQKEAQLFKDLWERLRIPLTHSLLLQDPSLLPPELRSYFDVSLLGLSDWKQLKESIQELNNEECAEWLKSMRSFQELERPLWCSKKGLKIERDLAVSFYPAGGFGFTKSHAIHCGAPLGSIFKLVVAYEALRQKGPSAAHFTIFDEVGFDKKNRMLIVGTTAERKPLYRHYKGGRLPRSHLPDLGKVDLTGAIEQSSNPYFSLLAGDFLDHPDDLTRAAAQFGFGERSNIDLPGEYKGNLPVDAATNRTGLYSFAIGQHTLLSTPLQSSLMLGALATHGKLVKPQIAHLLDSSTSIAKTPILAQPELSFLGIDFSLFGMPALFDEILTPSPPQEPILRRIIPLPASIRSTIFEGMDRTVWGAKGSARPSAIKGLVQKPHLLKEFLTLQHQMIGKTSTAEWTCRMDKHPSAPAQMYKHIWFGSLSFEPTNDIKTRWDRPELAVVVYLRYGDGGKEAAPLAAQVIRKWREIQLRTLERIK